MFHDEHGPFLFDENSIHQANFLQMLKNYAYLLLRTRQPLSIFSTRRCVCPLGWGLIIRSFLMQVPRMLDRHGAQRTQTHWTFCLWGCVKICIYQSPMSDLQNLKDRIRQVPGEVTNIMRGNTWREMASRLQMLQDNGGRIVEMYCFF